MGRLPRLLSVVLAFVAAIAAAPPALASGPFANWAAIIVAGDWHAHSGAPSEVFDNARRDLTKAFIQAGFSPTNINDFSVRPEHYAAEKPLKSEPETILGRLTVLSQQATGGCLVYFTSHGAPTGVVVDGHIWPPIMVSQLVDRTCGARPTVVVISACFSGVFVPAVQGSNRMVLTAARPDRTSFGCGEQDRYTYFDGCFLKSLAQAHDFLALGVATRKCVADLEIATHAQPPSEPQMDVGGLLRPMLPLYAFAASRPEQMATTAANPKP